LSFSALLYLGGQIYQQAPPIPNAVQIVNGNVIYSKQDIEDGLDFMISNKDKASRCSQSALQSGAK
jgi:nitric oxide reductase large subunit